MNVAVLFEVRCAGCGVLFYLCEAEYRGHIYGSKGCKQDARRAARARHQASPEGRLDHRDAMRNFRQRRRRAFARVTDTRSNYLPAKALSCPRDDASFSIEEEHAVVAESMRDATNHSDDGASGARDATARDGGERRSDACDLGTDNGESSASGSDFSRGACAMAPAGALRCVVCGCRGLFIRDAASRRSGLRNKKRSLQRRARLPSGPRARAPASRHRQLS